MTKNIEKPTIVFPVTNNNQIVSLTSGWFGAIDKINKRFERMDQILYGIMIAIVLSMIAIIISTIGLFIDQMHHNNAAYTNYYEKLDSVNSTQEINKEILEQNKALHEEVIELLKTSNKQTNLNN